MEVVGRASSGIRELAVPRQQRATASGALTSLGAMRQEVIWDHEAARRYDTPGTGMLAPRVLGPAVGRIAQLASDGRAQESAIGAGRVAIPWLGAACLSRASSYPA